MEAVNTLQMQQSSCSRFTVLYFENDEENYILPFKGQLQMMKLKLMVANPSRCFLCYFQVKNADATQIEIVSWMEGIFLKPFSLAFVAVVLKRLTVT